MKKKKKVDNVKTDLEDKKTTEVNTTGNKKLKKKLKIKIIPLFIFIVLCLFLYLAYMLFSDLPIKNIYIKGNNVLSDYEIIHLAEIQDYPSFIKTTDKNIIKKLKSSNYINKVKINRKFYNKLYITVEENVPYLIGEDGLLILSNGNKYENDKNFVLPSLINYVPDVKFEELIKKIKRVNKKIWLQVSEIKYEPTDQDKDRFLLYMNDGNQVYLTLTKFTKINYYNEIVSEFKCQKGVLNLDSGNHFEIKINECE